MNKAVIDLSTQEWTVEGWREWEWLLGRAIESGTVRAPDVRPVAAAVPGSVRAALVAAGVVPDPRSATRSRESEFLEHRHWIFRTRLPGSLSTSADTRATLRFESLDGRGAVYLNGQHLIDFATPVLPTEVELPAGIELAGGELAVVFHSPPSDLGQIGWTSKRRDWKPRFNYGWDWTPRIVQTAIVGSAVLELASGNCIESIQVRPSYRASSGQGCVEARIRTRHGDGHTIELALMDGDRVVATQRAAALDEAVRLRLDDLPVQPWHPFSGPPRRYTVRARLYEGEVLLDSTERTVGFRQITWGATTGAPEAAEPWLCAVNGTPVFLQGVNWVPIRPDYADVPPEEYRRRLQTYRDLGVNILRVWGGAALERPLFYELCDELGLLVWQELPLCSSGLDNYPPDDPDFVADFAEITESYVNRIGHHACIAIWGGGNELAGDREGMAVSSAPLGFAHPALDAARRVLERSGIDAKVVATSPSGPAFSVEPGEQEGTNHRGLHHDAHGPWAFDGPDAEWERYWEQDDAMLRSEVGAAGASSRDLLEEFELWVDGERPEVWEHSSAWWITDERCTDESIQASQARQARRLAVAARASKARYPACAGFIVWLGHDSFPCAISLALLDAHGRPKPAAHALGEVFAQASASSTERATSTGLSG